MAVPMPWVYNKVENIQKYAGNVAIYPDYRHGGVILNEQVIIAKKKTRFRPLGQLDWAHYTAKGLGTAFQEDSVLEYYERMLNDERSPSHDWKGEKMMDKRAYYAERRGNASLVPNVEKSQ
mgnify:CR=1 FL=1